MVTPDAPGTEDQRARSSVPLRQGDCSGLGARQGRGACPTGGLHGRHACPCLFIRQHCTYQTVTHLYHQIQQMMGSFSLVELAWGCGPGWSGLINKGDVDAHRKAADTALWHQVQPPSSNFSCVTQSILT